VTLAFEKMLMAACLPVAVAMHTWGAVATVGAEAAAYYLAALLGILYYSFAVPLPSSFFRKPASRGIGVLSHTSCARSLETRRLWSLWHQRCTHTFIADASAASQF